MQLRYRVGEKKLKHLLMRWRKQRIPIFQSIKLLEFIIRDHVHCFRFKSNRKGAKNPLKFIIFLSSLTPPRSLRDRSARVSVSKHHLYRWKKLLLNVCSCFIVNHPWVDNDVCENSCRWIILFIKTCKPCSDARYARKRWEWKAEGSTRKFHLQNENMSFPLRLPVP